jgi:hypothetical protein
MRRTCSVATSLVLTSLVVTGGAAPTAAVGSGGRTGPASSESPYLLSVGPGVQLTSLLTVGDAAENGYRLVGAPDGLGAFDNGDGTFTLLVDHEYGVNKGVVRAHGARGAFVSRWVVDESSLEVHSGEDLMQRLHSWVGPGEWQQIVIPLASLCSAYLADRGSLYDADSGTGTSHRILLNGEEGGQGRAVAHVVEGADAGSSYVLPDFGRASWENHVVMPRTGRTTMVFSTDDNTDGEVYVYIGEKSATGNDIERAGLVGGQLYGLRLEGVEVESDATSVPREGIRFALIEMSDPELLPVRQQTTRAQLEALSHKVGLSMARPEDAAWDTSEHGAVYFATTGHHAPTAFGISRLWRLAFDDPGLLTAGGTATVAAASPPFDPVTQAGPHGMDNLTVNERGQVLVQEDGGPRPYLSGVWLYDARFGTMVRLAQHDPARFLADGDEFLTETEETSGIIPAPFLGRGRYLLTTMAHDDHPELAALVEGGQLMVMKVPPRSFPR